jgi:hypothetical protein
LCGKGVEGVVDLNLKEKVLKYFSGRCRKIKNQFINGVEINESFAKRLN